MLQVRSILYYYLPRYVLISTFQTHMGGGGTNFCYEQLPQTFLTSGSMFNRISSPPTYFCNGKYSRTIDTIIWKYEILHLQITTTYKYCISIIIIVCELYHINIYYLTYLPQGYINARTILVLEVRKKMETSIFHVWRLGSPLLEQWCKQYQYF